MTAIAPTKSRVVVVGGGQAGFSLIAHLRGAGHEGPIALIEEQDARPYQRPPLTKALLQGELDPDDLDFVAAEDFTALRLDWRPGRRAVAIRRDQRALILDDGETLAYDYLILATGAKPRSLPGGQPASWHCIATMSDTLRLRKMLDDARDALIVGGGFIGLEVAASLRHRGLGVTLIEAQERLLARSVSAPTAQFLAALHERQGVRIRAGCTLAGWSTNGSREHVMFDDGAEIDTDLVLVGIGSEPDTELAKAAGLDCANGIVVDAEGRTTDPNIYAIGDCAWHPNPHAADGYCRLESVHNAADQGVRVASAILALDVPSPSPPLFWSEQYDAYLAIAGLGAGHDCAVVTGPTEGDGLTTLLYRSERLVAVETINRPRDHKAARKLLAQGTPIPIERASGWTGGLSELADD